MPAILITGTKSFVGENFIRFSEYKDIREISLLQVPPATIDFAGIDVVLHLAALVHAYGENPDDYYKINRDLSLAVAQNAKAGGVKQFIFMSTSKVYGDYSENALPCNEKSVCKPSDHYGKSKLQAETGLIELMDKDFTVSVIRTPVVYGPGVKGNILKLIKLAEKFPVLPFAQINNQRNFTFAGNLAGYIDRIIKLRAPGIFIAMDEQPVSTTCIIEYLSKHLGKKLMLIKLPRIFIKIAHYLNPRIIEPLFGSAILDNSFSRKILDFTPPYSMETGIIIMIKYYRSNNK